MFCIFLVRWRKNVYSKKIKATNASNSDQFVEEKVPELPLQTKENQTKVNATVDNHRDIEQTGRKRKLESVTEKVFLAQDLNIVQRKMTPKKQCRSGKKERTSEQRPNQSVRFNHSLEHLPYIDKSRLVRCKNDLCNKKTYVLCKICNVHLCFNVIDNRNCFTDFHLHSF